MRAQWVCSRERRIALYKRSSINKKNMTVCPTTSMYVRPPACLSDNQRPPTCMFDHRHVCPTTSMYVRPPTCMSDYHNGNVHDDDRRHFCPRYDLSLLLIAILLLLLLLLLLSIVVWFSVLFCFFFVFFCFSVFVSCFASSDPRLGGIIQWRWWCQCGVTFYMHRDASFLLDHCLPRIPTPPLSMRGWVGS